MLTIDFDRLGVRRGDRVLDLGCGGGRHAFEAQRRGAQVFAVDTDVDELAGVRDLMAAIEAEGGPPGPDSGEPPATPVAGLAVRADGRWLPFADATFDHVIAAEVLEHVHDDGGVLAEMHRVLRPGGRAVVTVPRLWPERVCWALSTAYHEVEGGHVRIYARRRLLGRLRAAGLVPTGSAHAHALHSPYWWLKCLVGVDRDVAAVRLYHRLLVWDLMRRPLLTRALERALNPVLGKSLVVYAQRPPPVGAAGPVPPPDDLRTTAPHPTSRPDATTAAAGLR